uniref:GATA-type domain-containing protein n=1 Tax=Bionectria ochroleuca TaxID=29856 RepID=A0A8H7ND99_BIOOC
MLHIKTKGLLLIGCGDRSRSTNFGWLPGPLRHRLVSKSADNSSTRRCPISPSNPRVLRPRGRLLGFNYDCPITSNCSTRCCQSQPTWITARTECARLASWLCRLMSSLLPGTLSAAACATTPGNLASNIANSFSNTLHLSRPAMGDNNPHSRNTLNQHREPGAIRTALPSRPMSSTPTAHFVGGPSDRTNQTKSTSVSPSSQDVSMLDVSSYQSHSPNTPSATLAPKASPPAVSSSHGGQVCSNCGTTRTPLWRRSPRAQRSVMPVAYT